MNPISRARTLHSAIPARGRSDRVVRVAVVALAMPGTSLESISLFVLFLAGKSGHFIASAVSLAVGFVLLVLLIGARSS